MILVDISDETTKYILTAELQNGDLVVSASDFSPSVKDTFGTDEYEYWYIVKAQEIWRLSHALGCTQAQLLEKLRDLLAPHGYTASTHYKAWLVEKLIPYSFTRWK